MSLHRRIRYRPLIGLTLVSVLCDCRCNREGPPGGQGSACPTSGRDVRVELALRAARRDEWRRVSAASIRDGLSDKDSAVRARAALAAGRSGVLSNSDKLLALLGADPDAEVRRQAAFALRLLVLDASRPGEALEGRVARAFAERLASEDAPDGRREVIVSLGWTGDGKIALPVIEQLLKQPPVAQPQPKIEGQPQPQPQPKTKTKTKTKTSADLAAGLTAAGVLAYRNRLDQTERAALARALQPLLEHPQPSLRMLATWARARLKHPPGPAALAALRRVADGTGDRTLAAVEARAWAIRAIGRAKLDDHPRLVDWLASARMRDPDVGPQVEAIRALAGGGQRAVVKLCGALDELWRSIGQSHFRLTGRRLRAMLVALEVLEPHARLATVKRLARSMLELSDASDAAVRYSPVEAHSVDLVHCAAARLADLGLGRPEHSATCGTARAAAVTAPMRRAWVASLIGKMNRPPQWKLTLLRRYLTDSAVQVRGAALEALSLVDSPLVEAPLLGAVQDRDDGVLGAAALAVAARAAQLSLDGRKRLSNRLVARLAALAPLGEPDTCCDLVKALGALGQSPPLQRLLASPAWAVRRCAYDALEARGVKPEPSADGHGSRGLPELSWSGDRPPPRKAVIVTHKGEIFLELFADETPATAANLGRLATRRFYRGIRLHRVVPGFVVQGGDPRGDGRGGPGYTIPCELTPRPYLRGSVGMALAGRDTGGSQIFITLSRQPHLDGRYTQLGRVTKGMDVVDRLHVGDEIKDLYIP